MARRTTWTPELWEQILEALRAGATQKAAYQFVGVPEPTFFQWVKERPELRDDLEEAKARAHVRVSSRLMQLVDERDPQSVRFFLERRYPADWGQKVQQDVEMKVETVNPVDEVRDRIARLRDLSQPPETGDDQSTTE